MINDSSIYENQPILPSHSIMSHIFSSLADMADLEVCIMPSQSSTPKLDSIETNMALLEIMDAEL
jgi:hypothetical protein